MKIITEQQYKEMSNDYKGVYSDYQGTHPHLRGKRTILTHEPKRGTVLLIEGSGLKIVKWPDTIQDKDGNIFVFDLEYSRNIAEYRGRGGRTSISLDELKHYKVIQYEE